MIAVPVVAAAAGRMTNKMRSRRALEEPRTSGQDVFLESGLRAVGQAFHNLNCFRRETLGLSCLARPLPRFATTRVLAGPNTSWVAVQTGPVPRRKSAAAPLSTASATSGSSVLSCNLRPLATAAKPISRYRLDNGSRPPLAWPRACGVAIRSLGMLQPPKKKQKTTGAGDQRPMLTLTVSPRG